MRNENKIKKPITCDKEMKQEYVNKNKILYTKVCFIYLSRREKIL